MRNIPMRYKKTLLVIFLCPFAIIMVSCSPGAPSESVVQTAIAQTQAVQPTATASSTATPEPTFTATELPTETPTKTLEPTATDTPTPTPDLRVIAIESEKFMLKVDDLPAESRFYLPNSGWISPHKNYEVISGWGEEKGREYLELSGRIDGWWVFYARGSTSVRAPQEIFHNIIQYKSREGAFITVRDFNRITYDRGEAQKYSFIDEDLQLGDLSLAMISKERQPNGKNLVWLLIETCYRNYVSVVGGYGWEDEVTLEYMIGIQKLALEKLAAAPLVETFK
jgi:hypothetical protein